MTHELTKEVKDAMSALEAFKSDLLVRAAKFDAFDEAKFNRIQDDIAKAIETAQAEKGRAQALEDEQKALKESHARLEGELTGLKTAFNRAPAPSDTKDADKEVQTKRNRLFNDFARAQGDGNKEYFDSYLRKQVPDQAELKALSVGSDPDGGYLTMPESGGIIQTKVYESSPLRQLASVITIGSDEYEVILDNDEAASGWVGETQARPDTNTPRLSKLLIPVNEMYAQPKATQKVLNDAGIDMEAWLASKVADKFARDEATAFVSGNGVMKPKGILSYAAGTDLALQQIQQVNSGSAGAFTYDGFVDLQSALKEPYQANAVFLLQRASNAAVMKIKDAENRPIFNMTYDKNVGLQPTIMGKPVYFAADMPAVASAALAAAYGDFRAAYQVVDRQGISVLRDPFTDKPYVKFYTTRRVGGAVVNFEALKLQKLS